MSSTASTACSSLTMSCSGVKHASKLACHVLYAVHHAGAPRSCFYCYCIHFVDAFGQTPRISFLCVVIHVRRRGRVTGRTFFHARRQQACCGGLALLSYRGTRSIDYPAQGDPCNTFPPGSLWRRYRIWPYVHRPTSFQHEGN